MTRHPFITTDHFRPLSPARLDRRQRIAAMMAATAKASERDVPPEERRQVIDLRGMRFPLTDHAADMLAGGGALDIGDAWTAWDWLRYAAPWAALGFLILGPAAFLALRYLVP